MEINVSSPAFIKIINPAIQAALDAGIDIMKIYSSDFQKEIKEDGSPITIADRKSNECIISILEKTGLPVLSEESAITNYEERKLWEYFWLIDPIDGTKEFINRNDEFTVNIALIKKDTPIAGIIYAPALNWFYIGIQGIGAYFLNSNDIKKTTTSEVTLNTIVNKGKKLVPGKINENKYSIAASKSHFNTRTAEFIDKLKSMAETVTLVPVGSSLKFCLLAEGKCNLYPRYGKTYEWDTAAGHAIVIAAGGEVYDLSSKIPMHYNKENLENPYFIALPEKSQSDSLFEKLSF